MTKLGKIRDEARDRVSEYLDEWEKEYEEYDVEAPIYYAELEQCKTIYEIMSYMREFGWEERYQVEKWKIILKRDIIKLNDEITKYEKELIDSCESYIEIINVMKSFNFPRNTIKKYKKKYIKPF